MMAPGSTALWASLPLPALVIDPDGRIAAVNPAAETFLNQSARALVGHPFLDRLLIDAPMEDALARVRRHLSPVFIAEADLTPGDRPPQSCSLSLAPLQDAVAGKVLVLIGQRELAERLGRAQGAVTAAKSAIGMAEMLAHEIKNPLAGITGAAQLLAMNLPPEDQELTDLIVQESRRIVQLLDQVEQFGDLRPPALRPVNIHDALDRARRSALVGFGAHMRIVEDYDPSLPATFADDDQLMQVFLNLLKNASEASPQGGTIRLHTFYDHALRRRRKDGSQAVLPLQIEIVDDGPGIPPAIASDIFEPFVSGHENGTGLGLALVSKIITDHEGWVSVESRPGRTAFRISLPLAPRDSKLPE